VRPRLPPLTVACPRPPAIIPCASNPQDPHARTPPKERGERRQEPPGALRLVMLWGSRSFQTHCAFRDRFTCVPLRWCPSRYGPVRLDPAPPPPCPPKGGKEEGGKGSPTGFGPQARPLGSTYMPRMGMLPRWHGQSSRSAGEEQRGRGGPAGSKPPAFHHPTQAAQPTQHHDRSRPVRAGVREGVGGQRVLSELAGRGQGSLAPQAERGSTLSAQSTRPTVPTPARSSHRSQPVRPPNPSARHTTFKGSRADNRPFPPSRAAGAGVGAGGQGRPARPQRGGGPARTHQSPHPLPPNQTIGWSV